MKQVKLYLCSAAALMMASASMAQSGPIAATRIVAMAAKANVVHTVYLELPLTIDNGTLLYASATLTNVQSGEKYTIDQFDDKGEKYAGSVSLPEGTYNIQASGKVKYTVDGAEEIADVKAELQNVTVNGGTAVSTTMALNMYKADGGLVITELFYTGTTTPEGKQYSNDQYIKIGNNSNETIYLDGMAFAESEFLTTTKETYKPDIMEEAMAVDGVYVFPGSGKEHPLAPGKEVIIAINANNHKEANANSFDLSKADFEIYDVSTIPSIQDTDNPDVPNMISYYRSSKTIFTMHNRGFKAYAIGKPTVGLDDYVANYKYDFSYDLNANGTIYPMKRSSYKFPNAWIVDAVNCSVPSLYQWNVTSATLDAGYTSCGQVDHDKTRYGKAVIRKKSGDKWIDTNNSSDDFIKDATPSLMAGTDGVEELTANNIIVKGGVGGVTISLDKDAAVDIYSLSGQKVYGLTMAAGQHTVDLQAGLYIIKVAKTPFKVTVK